MDTTREKLIASFQDTLSFFSASTLLKATNKTVELSKVYYEGFESKHKNRINNCRIVISPNTTFAEARKYVKYGKVAVLNFANPVYPGGGVEFGAIAQEECLCRSSNLYACLSDRRLYDDYYGYHKNLHNHFYSDRLIYSPGVMVFKDDSYIPKKLPRWKWFNVDVITCAAPYSGASKYINSTVLVRLFEKRIISIMESALDNDVDTIVLGAFGCGAFKNPPRLVAQAFKTVIDEHQYRRKFKNIVFAIKEESEKDYGQNYCAFYEVFEGGLLLNCPNYDLPEILLPTGKIIEKATVGFLQSPANTTIEDVKDMVARGDGFPTDDVFQEDELHNEACFKKQQNFLEWQRNNPYYKKQISILGDSISTLDGYNPDGYKVFFIGDKCVKANVFDMKDTWWGQAIDLLGAELLVNDSWSRSRVAKLADSDRVFPSGCSDERTGNLHINDTIPDVILVYLGTNDWGYGVLPEPKMVGFFDEEMQIYVDGFVPPDETVFSYAYEMMLKKLQRNYPKAEICCFTLNTSFTSQNPNFTFPAANGGVHIGIYNNIIRNAANMYGCKLVDLEKYHIAYDSIDGTHPNAEGMKTLATMVLRELDEKTASFLDYQN